MTDITFAGQLLQCRKVHTYPSRFKLGDILIGPGGNLLKVVTVQCNIPVWEDNHKVKTAVVFETQDKTIVPVPGINGVFDILRPRKVA